MHACKVFLCTLYGIAWACIITEDKDKQHATAIEESEGSLPLQIKEKENAELKGDL